jgi:DNA-binding IscR family transcriptional regulator
MKITTKSRYGLRAIGIIAENFEKGPTPVSVIARKEGIDVLYLEQLLNRLKKAGFLKT